MRAPRKQVCDLKCQRCSITVFAADEVPHFVMDADAETGIDAVLLTEPFHGHEDQMEVVHCRALDHPVDSARDKLRKYSNILSHTASIASNDGPHPDWALE